MMLSLRPARSADIARLSDIGLRAWEMAIAGWGEDGESMRDNASKAYADFCGRQWPDILVAEWEGEAVGWGACEKADDVITDLWVLPPYQGRGIGTRLLGRLEQQVAGRNYHHARLETHARNAGAIKLYKQLGYQVRAYVVAYSPPLDRDIDKVEMIKHFDGYDAARIEAPDDGLYGLGGD
ncbi:GNAT family N-acetyltransferase [Pseudohoeflea coraliihabitans]|uniref:GNAT family N-acetyltransferase n=1 Tax=Pseudohoeflea coraliihabitans TaxID=2860393 RepID=A0ABS6WTJ3_9HYPH|nr:GNAT family N-acetyltransferase [Pseudohoeflea sp. DP4N28-3]MBW3098928.1 GNAT family N-acetyltransferase [Pseudohoeflea sp. DP4N28-3]